MSAIPSKLTTVQESLKEFSLEELLSLTANAVAEAKKKAKSKPAAKEKAEKKGSMPKGVVPPQLRIPHAWVAATLQDTHANGWEAFEVTGKTPATYGASVFQEGAHVFADSGKPMNHKLAMSLSKQRKEKQPAKYAAFLEEFHAKEKMGGAKVEEEVKEEVKEEPKVPAAKKEAPKKEAPKKEAAAKKEAAPKKEAAKKEAKKKEEWSCPDDGAVHRWEFGGKTYARNFQNQVWLTDASGEVSDWAGVFDGKKIDASVEEPTYDE